MRAINLGGPCHLCHDCDKFFPGDPETKEILAEDYSKGYPYEEVSTYTVYLCGDPNGACEVDEERIEYFPDTWQCGDCEEFYPSAGDAISCCA